MSADHITDVRRQVDDLREAASDSTLVWLTVARGEPVGIEVPAGPLLGAGIDHLVSRAADLMLTSRDVTDGVSIELNDTGAGDEYEIAGWGVLRL